MDRLEDAEIQSKNSPDQPLNCCGDKTGYQPSLVLRRLKISFPALYAEIPISSFLQVPSHTNADLKFYIFGDIRNFSFLKDFDLVLSYKIRER